MSTEREALTQLLEWTQTAKARFIDENKRDARKAINAEERNEILSERIGARIAFEMVIEEIQDRLAPCQSEQPQ